MLKMKDLNSEPLLVLMCFTDLDGEILTKYTALAYSVTFLQHIF